MATSADSGAARDGSSLASRWLQVVLEVDLATSHSCRQKMCEQGTVGTHLPHGGREPDVGCAAHPWRVEDARFRHLEANRAALDEAGPPEFGAGKRCVNRELWDLISRMVAENRRWGAPRIHGEDEFPQFPVH